jgi:hypothetical protein
MSGSTASDPPGRAERRGGYLCFGLLIVIGLVQSHNSPHGLAGTPNPGSGETLYCPHCEPPEPGNKIPGGFYRCKNKHLFTSAQAKRKGKWKGSK